MLSFKKHTYPTQHDRCFTSPISLLHARHLSQHRGVKLALSQKAKCAAFLPPNSHLFGIQHDDQNVESGARRDGRGSRSRAEAAKDLPPLTHSDLIEQLRSATAGL